MQNFFGTQSVVNPQICLSQTGESSKCRRSRETLIGLRAFANDLDSRALGVLKHIEFFHTHGDGFDAEVFEA